MESVRAAFEYRFPVDRLVLRFKDAADFAVGRWLARQLAAAVRHEPRPDLLVVPPPTRARLRQRGFDPPGEIARRLARELGLRFAVGAMERTRETAAQRGLSRAERRANLRGAFRCRADVRGLRVAVVEDVVTTGATAEAMADALASAGARATVVWSIARTPFPEG